MGLGRGGSRVLPILTWKLYRLESRTETVNDLIIWTYSVNWTHSEAKEYGFSTNRNSREVLSTTLILSSRSQITPPLSSFTIILSLRRSFPTLFVYTLRKPSSNDSTRWPQVRETPGDPLPHLVSGLDRVGSSFLESVKRWLTVSNDQVPTSEIPWSPTGVVTDSQEDYGLLWRFISSTGESHFSGHVRRCTVSCYRRWCPLPEVTLQFLVIMYISGIMIMTVSYSGR